MEWLLISIIAALKGIVAVVSVFVVCIVLHEFGHFIVAKKSGVAVPAFAIGFGPKLVTWTRRGTEFSIRLFPLGGLVQLAGEMPQDSLFRKGEQIAVEWNEEGYITKIGDPSDVPGGTVCVLKDLDLIHRLQMTLDTGDRVETYSVMPHARLMTSQKNFIPIVERHEQVLGKPLWQRAAMILAGPVMNFLLAGVLFSAWFTQAGSLVDTPVLGGVVANTPAAISGLQSGDEIVAINNQPVHSWTQLVQIVTSDRSNPPATLLLDVRRNGQTSEIKIKPKLTPDHVAQLGVEPTVSHNVFTGVQNGFSAVYLGSVNAFQMYGDIIRHHQLENLSGPVGIADVISQSAQTGFWRVVMIAGLLSLNLGLFNLLPIPALDGGRLLFMIVELVRGKAVDPRKEGFVHLLGFGLLMLFAAVITFRDVSKLF